MYETITGFLLVSWGSRDEVKSKANDDGAVSTEGEV